jgi:EAL domain-containing protein (putative c-di-GMP-specific phosphodiesterase class I)
MKVTAEGVATERQRDYLVTHGCHELQGFLLSEPLPLEAFLDFPGVGR